MLFYNCAILLVRNHWVHSETVCAYSPIKFSSNSLDLILYSASGGCVVKMKYVILLSLLVCCCCATERQPRGEPNMNKLNSSQIFALRMPAYTPVKVSLIEMIAKVSLSNLLFLLKFLIGWRLSLCQLRVGVATVFHHPIPGWRNCRTSPSYDFVWMWGCTQSWRSRLVNGFYNTSYINA